MAGLAIPVRARFCRGRADPLCLASRDALREGERTAGEAAVVAGLSVSITGRHLSRA